MPGVVLAQPIFEGFDDFDTGVRPVGWTFFGCDDNTDTYTDAADSGPVSGAPSIKLDTYGDYIETEPLVDPVELSFWVKGQGTDASSALLVEEYYALGSSVVATIMPLPDGPLGEEVGPFPLGLSSTSVRFIFLKSAGDLAFDDVLITGTEPSPTPAPTATASPSATPTPEGFKSPTPAPTPDYLFEGFDGFRAEDGWTTPPDWNFIGIVAGDNFTDPDDSGPESGPPAVRFDEDGDTIETETIYRPDELWFWVKGIGTDLSTGLLVEETYSAGWTEVTKIMPLPAAGAELGPFPLGFLSTQVRFRYERFPGDPGAMAFDDVRITWADPTPVPTATPTPTVTPTISPTPTATPTPLTNFFNPSFELEPPLVGWEVVATRWTERSDEQAYDGDYSVEFREPTTNYDGRGVQTADSHLVSVTPGEEYVFSGWFFVLPVSGDFDINNFWLRFNVIWLDDDGETVSVDSDADWSLDEFNTWTERDWTLTAPPGATQVRIYIACRRMSSASQSNVYIDQFNLSRPPPPTPSPTVTPTPEGYKTPVPTPSPDFLFEGFDGFRAEDGWTTPPDWNFIGIGVGDNFTEQTDSGPESGVPAVRFDAQSDTIETEELFRPEELWFWVKGVGTDLSTGLLVEETYSAGWTEVTKIMPLPAAGAELGPFPLGFLATHVRFVYQQFPGDTGAMAFDDVKITWADPTPSPSLTPVPTATPTLTPSPSPSPTPLTDFYNPSFEFEPPLVGWEVVASRWTERSDEQAYDGDHGDYSVEFREPTRDYDGRGIQTADTHLVPVIPGERYIFSGWFFVFSEDSGDDINNVQFRFNVIWLDAAGEMVFVDADEGWSLNEFNTWTERVKTLTAPLDAAQVRIYIACQRASTDYQNDAYIDLFTLSRPPDINVTSPASAAAWYIGEARLIEWETIGEVEEVDIHYSIDNGATWNLLASAIDDTGSWLWNPIPGPASADARVRVRETSGDEVEGISGRFTIAAPDTINVISPGGGETWYRTVNYDIQWSAGPDVSGDPVDIYYSVDNGASWIGIDTAIPIADGTYEWTIPDEDSPDCLVRVHQPATGREGISPDVFLITSPRITVTRPVGGERWYLGETQTITWSYTAGVVGNVDIDISLTGPGGPWYQIAANQPNTGSYAWPVPNINTDQARVRVSEVGGISLPGISPDDFTIVGTTPPQPSVDKVWERWMQVPIPDGCSILSIKAFDENNIWLGCSCGVIYYWDGQSWQFQAQRVTNFRDFVAFRPDLVYGAGNTGGIHVYNGTSWSGRLIPEGRYNIQAIDGPDPDHIIASASSAMAYVYRAGMWQEIDFDSSGTLRSVVYLRPNEAYTLRASTETQPTSVFRSTDGGQSWSIMRSFGGWTVGDRPMAGCIDQFGRTRLWIVGGCGTVSHYNGASWVTHTQIEFLSGRTVEVLDENNVWASIGGDIYHFNGTEWIVEDTSLPTVYQFSAVSNRLVYAIGSTASRWIFRAIGDATPTPYQPTPVGFKTPSPTPVPQSGPIRGRVYDRVSGEGVKGVYVRAFPVEQGLRTSGDITDSAGFYSIQGFGGPLEAGLYQVFAQGSQGEGILSYRDQWYNQKDSQRRADVVTSNSSGIDFPLYRVGSFPTPVPTATPFFPMVRVESGDYSGDGTSDIAIFRPASGLWAVRGVTRAYFGTAGDIPVSGDYSGDGFSDIALYRPGSGLWAVRGVTRAYFGTAGDIPVPGDYDGDGSTDIAVFRPATGLWAVSSLGRVYFGGTDDIPVSGDYTGDGFRDIAIFRPSTGLWAVKDVTRFYFGGWGDTPVPGYYEGLGITGPAIFRPSSGLWAVRGVTRFYFGNAAFQAVPSGYSGYWQDRAGVFRPATGLWAVRGLTRVYFGGQEDLPVTR